MSGTGKPEEPTVDALREAIALQLTDNATLLQPLFDAADGMRADLVTRGWSESVSEHLAAMWLGAMLTKVGGA